MSNTERELRIESLKLAIEIRKAHQTPDDVITLAIKVYEYINTDQTKAEKR